MDRELSSAPGEDQEEPDVDLLDRVWALWLSALWSLSTVYGVCSSFHLLLLEIISMSSFLKGLAINVKLHVENEYHYACCVSFSELTGP